MIINYYYHNWSDFLSTSQVEEVRRIVVHRDVQLDQVKRQLEQERVQVYIYIENARLRAGNTHLLRVRLRVYWLLKALVYCLFEASLCILPP